MKTSLALTIILILIAGGLAFFGGLEYQKSQQASSKQFSGQNRRFFNGQNGNLRPVRGIVIASDDKSITVKLPDGSSKIVFLSDSTAVTEATSAGKESLIADKEVLIFGKENQDGSITAQNIQINPQFRAGQ